MSRSIDTSWSAWLNRGPRRRRHKRNSATAHPAKFEAVVEPLIGHEVGVPASLRSLLERPTSYVAVAPRLAELAKELDNW